MSSDRYIKSICELQKHFGISKVCAQYLFHRALKAKKSNDNQMAYSLQLQNALVKADKCIGINWEHIYFGQEINNLATHGIKISEQDSNKVFRWVEEFNQNSDWVIVSNKKKKSNTLAINAGVYM